MRLVVPPQAPPVSVAEFKEHARVDFADDDLMLKSCIDAAVSYLDGYSGVLGRCISLQTWAQDFCQFEREFKLGFPDISSAVIRYIDLNGNESIYPSDQYQLVGSSIYIRGTRPEIRRMANAVTVEFICGYKIVPDALKLAIKIIALRNYDNPDGFLMCPSKNDVLGSLLAPFRVRRI